MSRSDPRSVGTQPPESVGPFRAIRNFYRRFGRISGRASPSEFWWIVLWGMLASAAATILLWALGGGELVRLRHQDPASLNGFGRGFLAVWGLISLIHVIPWLALCVRRLHDVNRSGLWLLAGLIPIAGFIFLLICAVMPSTPEGARFDREVAQRGREQEERRRIRPAVVVRDASADAAHAPGDRAGQRQGDHADADRDRAQGAEVHGFGIGAVEPGQRAGQRGA